MKVIGKYAKEADNDAVLREDLLRAMSQIGDPTVTAEKIYNIPDLDDFLGDRIKQGR